MLKTYFVKISWVDPKQPLTRCHANDKVELDLLDDACSIIQQCDKQVYGYSERKTGDITIDFMIECPA